jgi:hypothetical protein
MSCQTKKEVLSHIIPEVRDRLISQEVLNILVPILFSPFFYGLLRFLRFLAPFIWDVIAKKYKSR